MSVFLDPRVVEKPYGKRWTRAAWDLFLRSPLRFGILVATLAWLDTAFLRSALGLRIPHDFMQALSLLTLPLVWAGTCALARGADDRAQTMGAFAAFLRIRLWVNILVAGALLMALYYLASRAVFFLFEAVTLAPIDVSERVSRSGQLLGAILGQSVVVYICCGACFSPLLVLMPALGFEEVRRLSRRAMEINDETQFGRLLIQLLIVAAVPSIVLGPAYGLIDAAWLVFTGILNYVAYRDIFERRPHNLPREAVAATAALRGAVSG